MFQLFLLAAVALGSDYECFKDADASEICMVIPSDAPETASPKRAEKTLSPAKPPILMISENELSGGAASVQNEFSLETPSETSVAAQLQGATTSRSQESLRWIETFLKTGPASQSDDIFVRPASRD